MWTNEHAPRLKLRLKFTHYCPQCGERYYSEVRCQNCRIPAVPIPRPERKAA